jgi:acylphosphatase
VRGPEQVRAVRARVTGRVQGVGFRFSAVGEARRLGVRGWVRNADDGSLEVAAEGDPSAVARMLTWLRRGPPGAWVRDVEVVEAAPEGFAGFDVAF